MEKFLGKWSLLREQCDYQLGEPPREGWYLLEQEPGQVKVTMDWTDSHGQHHQQSYSSIPDGNEYPYPDSPAVDAVSMTLVNENRLDSAALKTGSLVNHAARELSPDGQVMKVTMTFYTPGATLINIAHYRREG